MVALNEKGSEMSEKKKTVRKDGKKSVSYRIPAELVEEMNKVCEDYGFNKSAFVAKAIQRAIDNLRDDSRLF